MRMYEVYFNEDAGNMGVSVYIGSVKVEANDAKLAIAEACVMVADAGFESVSVTSVELIVGGLQDA